VDVAIVFSADKKSAATRIRDGLASEGYSVDLVEGGGPASARALIVLWSRSAMESEAVQAAVSEARRQGRLIEASSDGIMPIGEGSESRTILISGWRGEPFHPGWQRISAEVRRLCGAPGAKPAPAKSAASAPATAARAPAPRRGALLAGALVLVLALVGAALWVIGSRSPEPSPVTASAVPPRAPTPAPEPAPVGEPVLADAAPPPEAEPIPSEPVAAAVPAAAPVPTAAPATAKRPAAKPKRSGPHYSPRQARTMRLFCQRAGRGTRECRIFRQRIAEGW